MNLGISELTWIECSLETELLDREQCRNDKVDSGKDSSQDEKDINAIKALLEKVRLEVMVQQ